MNQKMKEENRIKSDIEIAQSTPMLPISQVAEKAGIDENLLDAVIGLPEKLFYGTGIPAAILIFKKQKVDDKVLFIDASREFKAGKNQNQLSEENIEKIVKTYRDGDNVEKYAYLASLKEIQDNDYNLNIPRYVDTFEEEDEIDLLAVRAEREQLKAELVKLEMEMAGYLKQLGYDWQKDSEGTQKINSAEVNFGDFE